MPDSPSEGSAPPTESPTAVANRSDSELAAVAEGMTDGGLSLAEELFERCREQGLTESQATELSALGTAAVLGVRAHEASIGMRTLVTFAVLGRGNFALADAVLGMPGDPNTPELKLLDLAARLYRACVGAEGDPAQPLAAMNRRTEALVPVIGLQTPEARLARGYAGLTLSEALLRIGDVGAARQQLESVADEPGMPPGIAVVAGVLLGAIEQGVGRNDLALGHIQVALHRASQLGAIADEERLLRMVLIGLLLADNRRYGLAMLDDIAASKYGPLPQGNGTVARLYRLLQLFALPPPLAVTTRLALHEQLRWLQGRHNSAGWSLLLTSLAAGALGGGGDFCEAYSLLIEAAADLRCRYMDGVAELCDRQIAAIRQQLGPDAFDELLTEAQRRRRELRAVQRQDGSPSSAT
jgi:hypothetical protein